MPPIDNSPPQASSPASISPEPAIGNKRVVDSRIREELNNCVDDYGQDEPGLVSAIFGPDTDAFTNLVKAEATLFPEMADLPLGNYAFWTVIQAGRVLHAMRLSFPTVNNGLLAPFQIHEIIRSGQLGAKEIAEEYDARGHNLASLISAESHFRVESRERFSGSVGIPSYLGIIAYCLRTGRTGVLGHLNEISKTQFGQTGLLVEPASTETPLFTPALDDPSQVDPDYTPMLIPMRGSTVKAMEKLKHLVPQHLETYVDLRTPDTTPLARGQQTQNVLESS